MSREIKFRIWSYEDKQYRTDCNLTQIFNSVTGTPATVYSDEGDRFDIEQYTGLTDKNGKEIYEGDIVEFGLSGRAERGYVAYADEYASFEVYSKRDFIFGCLFGHAGKVIGNIHENPELLGDEE